MEFYWDIELKYQHCKSTKVTLLTIIIIVLWWWWWWYIFSFKYSGWNYSMQLFMRYVHLAGTASVFLLWTSQLWGQSTWLESGSWSQPRTPQLKKYGLSLLKTSQSNAASSAVWESAPNWKYFDPCQTISPKQFWWGAFMVCLFAWIIWGRGWLSTMGIPKCLPVNTVGLFIAFPGNIYPLYKLGFHSEARLQKPCNLCLLF